MRQNNLPNRYSKSATWSKQPASYDPHLDLAEYIVSSRTYFALKYQVRTFAFVGAIEGRNASRTTADMFAPFGGA
jgi:hypothetical protein